jgi:hypothetical protein
MTHNVRLRLDTAPRLRLGQKAQFLRLDKTASLSLGRKEKGPRFAGPVSVCIVQILDDILVGPVP